jgi:hypothetical protein
MVERRSPQGDEHLAGSGLRVGGLFVPQHLGAAVFVNADSPHGTILP